MHQKHKPQGKDRTPTTAFHWVVLFVLWPNFIGHFLYFPTLVGQPCFWCFFFNVFTLCSTNNQTSVACPLLPHFIFFLLCVSSLTRKTLNPKPDLCVLEEYFGLILRPFCFSRCWEQEHQMVGLETVPHFNVLGQAIPQKKYEIIEAISKDLGAHIMLSKM